MLKPLGMVLCALAIIGACATSDRVSSASAAASFPLATIAVRIAEALGDVAGERVLVRYDEQAMLDLVHAVAGELMQRQAFVTLAPYTPHSGFEKLLNKSDISIWLPLHPSSAYDPVQQSVVKHWLDSKRGRELHFHGNSINFDGTPIELTPAQHVLQYQALNIDYDELRRRLRSAEKVLRAGVVRVTSPGGTNIQFEVGNRPVNLQDGDASREKIERAVSRVDRQIELPAGALRVAPLEETVTGTIVIDQLIGGESGAKTARDVRMLIQRGRVVSVRASHGEAALLEPLVGADFGAFTLGFNEKLAPVRAGRWLPYYGYGAGVVRLALGDSAELGGDARAGARRPLILIDADVVIETPDQGVISLVIGGKLNLEFLDR